MKRLKGSRVQMIMNLDPDLLAAERAIDEFRCGRPVVVAGDGPPAIYAAVETGTPDQLGLLRTWGGAEPSLVISGERAAALGLAAERLAGAARLPLPAGAGLTEALRLATSGKSLSDRDDWGSAVAAADPVDRLIVRTLKGAWLLPAALRAGSGGRAADIEALVRSRVLHAVTAGGLAGLLERMDSRVVKVSEAHIPLADAPQARFVCFRTSLAAREHLAIVTGVPDGEAGVPVRLHSACLTGDVFGSLRCDCGDQLRRSVISLRELGGGVLLYLAQEGRGIGLANKLRAYALQDGGQDTIDADAQLGFSPDERQYGIAAAMLLALGYDRIRLLTNNPDKIEALREAGITIVGRLPMPAHITPQNRRYMDAKRTRARHLLDPAG